MNASDRIILKNDAGVLEEIRGRQIQLGTTRPELHCPARVGGLAAIGRRNISSQKMCTSMSITD
jgi:hypothetical protein